MKMLIVGVEPKRGTTKDGKEYCSVVLNGTYESPTCYGCAVESVTIYGDKTYYDKIRPYEKKPVDLINKTLFVDRNRRGYIDDIEILE